MRYYNVMNFKKNDTESFKDFIYRIFSDNFDIKLSDRKLSKINEDSVNNVLLINDYEFNIKHNEIYIVNNEDYFDTGFNNYEFKYYKINKDKDVKFLFGCELETCILTKCSNEKYLDELKNEENIYNEKYYWFKLLSSYIENTLFYNVDDNFINKFRYAYIMMSPKDDILNYRVDFKKRIISEINIVSYDEKYNNLIFTRDSSLICGDSLEKYEINRENITKEKIRIDSFHCEIVTPIINKVKDIKILYTNLFKKDCFRGNESAAFHVNVSMLNKENEPIFFSRGFLDCFLDLYEKYEDKNYDKYRPYGTSYADKILNYAKEYTYKNVKNMTQFNDNKETDYFYENFIKGKKYYRNFITFEGNKNAKYNSIHTKNGYIMEFRLFPTDDKKEPLINYLLDSVKLLKKANEIYSENYKEIINKVQRLNSEIICNYKPIKYYDGYIYTKDFLNDDFKDYTDFSQVYNNLEKLLKYHQQTIVFYSKIKEYKDVEEYEMKILNEITEVKEDFKFLFLENGRVILVKK